MYQEDNLSTLITCITCHSYIREIFDDLDDQVGTDDQLADDAALTGQDLQDNSELAAVDENTAQENKDLADDADNQALDEFSDFDFSDMTENAMNEQDQDTPELDAEPEVEATPESDVAPEVDA